MEVECGSFDLFLLLQLAVTLQLVVTVLVSPLLLEIGESVSGKSLLD